MVMAALDRSASGGQLFQRSSSMNKTEASETTPMAEEMNLVRQSSICVERCEAERGAGERAAQANTAMWYRNAVLALVGTLVVVGVVCAPSFANRGKGGGGVAAAIAEADKWEHASRALPFHLWVKSTVGSGKFLVTNEGPSITYHKGPILTGDKKGTLRVHVVFYGTFSASQKATITLFLSSFQTPKASKRFPTVAGWWNIMGGYRNTKKYPVAPIVILGSVVSNSYSLGKSLTQNNIETILVSSLKHGLALDPSGLYLVLTAVDVEVQGFCSSQCGTHSVIRGSASTKKANLPYAWVGDSAKQCGGYCAWPFFEAPPGAGPNTPALKSPNGDAGIDGMIINIASMIAGACSDPYGNGYYEGVAGDPLEAAGICGGDFGTNAFAGYPGDLLKDSKGNSFNSYGTKRRKYLLPWLFNPVTKQCAGQA